MTDTEAEFDQRTRDVFNALAALNDKDREDVEFILNRATADLSSRGWLTQLGDRLSPLIEEHPTRSQFIWLVTYWSDDNLDDSRDDIGAELNAWMTRLHNRFGVDMAGAMSRSLRGNAEWSAVTVDTYPGRFLKPTVRVQVDRLDGGEVVIKTTPLGFARLIYVLAGEWADVQSQLPSEDAEEATEVLEAAVAALQETVASPLEDRSDGQP